jgi:flavin-dependent dehydrogenase
MFFFSQGCVGISPIEGGMMNVCAVIRESELETYDCAPDAFLASRDEITERLRLLSRATEWLVAGPVIASEDLYWRSSGPYLAGDALISPEPFTGSGVLTALITGRMAGVAATYRYAPADYYRQVSGTLGWRTLFGSAVAAALDTGWARLLAPLTPLQWVFRLGQPRVRKETPH